MEIRFHNPYRHALLGLLFELGVLATVLGLLAALALLAARIA